MAEPQLLCQLYDHAKQYDNVSGEIDTYGITGIPSMVGGREVVQRVGLAGSTRIVYPGSGREDA